MNAHEHFKAGDLAAATQEQLQEVKSNPADQSSRLFLFELAIFSGDLERAQRQIDAIRYDDVEAQTGIEKYRDLVSSELIRRDVFQKEGLPEFLVDPPEHVKLRLQALEKIRSNDDSAAHVLLQQANEITPSIAGLLNGKPAAELSDADDLFGTVLEGMMHQKYFWIPLEQIASIAINPPSTPRDLFWIPARLETQSGPSGEIFLSALYPQSHTAEDDAVKLGRATDWMETESGNVFGQGLKTFIIGDDSTDENVNTILDWRELILATTADPGSTAEKSSDQAE